MYTRSIYRGEEGGTDCIVKMRPDQFVGEKKTTSHSFIYIFSIFFHTRKKSE